MVWVSVNVMVGGTTTPCLVKLVENSSPLAAVHVLVPEPPAGPIVQSAVTVNRPRWVALPVASRWWWLGTVNTVSKPSYVPLNGNSEPPSASVVTIPRPAGLEEDVVAENVVAEDVGAVGDAPEQATAKIQKPITTYRMCCPQRDSVSEARFNKVLPPRGVVMFLNSYRRRLRAAALIRRIVTEKRRVRRRKRGRSADSVRRSPRTAALPRSPTMLAMRSAIATP